MVDADDPEKLDVPVQLLGEKDAGGGGRWIGIKIKTAENPNLGCHFQYAYLQADYKILRASPQAVES